MAIITLDIGGTNLKGAIFAKDRLIEIKEIKTFVNDNTRDEFLINLDLLLNYFINKYKDKKVNSINIGIPGPYKNKGKGILGDLNNLPLNNFNIVKYITQKFHVDVKLANDADCFALGEFYFGGHNCKSLVGVTLGTGLGLGIVLNGEIYSGDGNAGEISGEKYKNSILENFVSKRALLRFTKKKGYNINDVKELYDEKYQDIWNELAKHLAFALSEIIMVIDPEIIVIGGKIAKAHKLFSKRLKDELKKQVKFKLPKIKYEKKNIALYGALKI